MTREAQFRKTFENGDLAMAMSMLSRLARAQFKEELDTAFESPPGSRYRRLFAEVFEGDVPIFDPDGDPIETRTSSMPAMWRRSCS
jgi:hypothetical protein